VAITTHIHERFNMSILDRQVTAQRRGLVWSDQPSALSLQAQFIRIEDSAPSRLSQK
jgi:hypothetical protein